MGLDLVEVVLSVEDAFQIHLPDEEVGGAVTVGALHELVLSKLDGKESKRCLTSAAFYRTRRGLVEATGVERRRIAPSTLVDEILPPRGRRDAWRRFRAAMTRMQLKLPGPRHPVWLDVSLIALGVAAGIAAADYGFGLAGSLMRIPLGSLFVLLGLALGALLARLTPPIPIGPPGPWATVGDLARGFLAANHARLVEEVGHWNRTEVWEILCRIIAEHTDGRADKIRPESSFVNDLGLG